MAMTRRSMHTDSLMPNFMIKEQVTLQSSEDTNAVGGFPPFPTKKSGSMRRATPYQSAF